MNERIEELKRQAWDYAYDHETVKGNVANDGFINKNFSDEFSKKFAELIVKECIAQCNDGDSRWFIAQHFGIEE